MATCVFVSRSGRGTSRCRRAHGPATFPSRGGLATALKGQRHLRSPRVLATAHGGAFTQKMVQDRVRWAARRAQLEADGVHILRHTFCSHLAMRGAPARAIQELAGHQDLSTTQRYMHLSPAAKESAIRLLDGPMPAELSGEDTSNLEVDGCNVLN